MKSAILILAVMLFSVALQAQEVDKLERQLCKKIFGSVPEADSISIDTVVHPNGRIDFRFSLPKQMVRGSKASSHPDGSWLGTFSIQVEILPAYTQDVAEQIKLLNDQLTRNDGDEKGQPVSDTISLADFSTDQYGFSIIPSSVIPSDTEARQLFADQMSQLFSACQLSDATETPNRTPKDFWNDVMEMDDF